MKRQRFDFWSDIEAHQHPRLILEMYLPVLDWVAELHAANRAHGNIHPSCLIVLENKQFCKDSFDAAVSEFMTDTSVYSPPEVLQDENPFLKASPLGDIYSLSAVLYRALVGQTPMRSALRRDASGDKMQLPRNLGSDLFELLREGMTIQPEKRLADLEKYRELLRKSLKAKEVTSLPPPIESSSPDIAKRLPKNLTIGKEAEIPVSDIIRNRGRWVITFTNTGELGIAHDEVRDVLICNPKVAGELKLNVEIRLPGLGSRFDRQLSSQIDVTVNADPRSLWKELEPPADAPFPKPHVATGEVQTPFARLHAASRRGRSHAHDGSFREDDFCIQFHQPSGWHLMAVSDGAGSARLSRRGSQIVCEQSIAQLALWLENNAENLAKATANIPATGDISLLRSLAYEWLGKAALESRKALQREVELVTQPASLKDFHATLLLGGALKMESGWLLVAFSIGDGGIVYSRTGGKPTIFCSPDSGEFSGQTTFITMPSAMKDAEDILRRIHLAFVTDLESLVLMTDGITDPLFPTEECLGSEKIWGAFFAQLPSAAFNPDSLSDSSKELAEWLNFWSAGNHDDRTLVLLVPKH